MDKTGAMFDDADDCSICYGGTDLVPFMQPLDQQYEQLQDSLHDQDDKQQSEHHQREQPRQRFEVGKESGSLNCGQGKQHRTPACLLKNMSAEPSDLITPVTGFQRTSSMIAAETRGVRLFNPRASAPLPLSLRHDTPMTDARVTARSRNQLENTELSMKPFNCGQQQPHQSSQFGVEPSVQCVPVVSQATRDHLMRWTRNLPLPPAPAAAIMTIVSSGDKRCLDNCTALGDLYCVEGNENLAPMQPANKRLRVEAPVIDWQKQIQEDGKICAERGEISLPRAPRIFRFRVGSGGSARQALGVHLGADALGNSHALSPP
jgi:hypothetical protein